MIGPDSNPTQGFRPSNQQLTGHWDTDEADYWRDNWRTRPYASADRDFGYYEPGYRFGYESANRYSGKSWDEVEPALSAEWNEYEHRGERRWEHMKDAVRDAWHRVTKR